MAALFGFFAVSLPFLIITTLAASTIDDQQLQQAIPFSYSGARGPEKWAALNPNFSACATGKLQSPINIVKTKCIFNHNFKPLDREYCSANATLINNGFNIGVCDALLFPPVLSWTPVAEPGNLINESKMNPSMRYEGNAGVLNIDGKNYSLIQMHWHSPSEHRINGVQYAAELHLVHKASDGAISVVALLYHYGHPDPLVTKIQNKLNMLARELHSSHELGQITLGDVNTREVRKKAHKYYRYIGSFTTPPCSENVIWNILGKVRSISRAQVEALRSPLVWGCKNNARPAQPLNGRQVEMYDQII